MNDSAYGGLSEQLQVNEPRPAGRHVECWYSRVFSTMRMAKRSTKKFPKSFLFGIVFSGFRGDRIE